MQRGFKSQNIDSETLAALAETARKARGDILTMTTLAGCGHPGGSMSSIDMYITLYSCATVYPDNPQNPDRDRIVISHGHTSPGVYAALSHMHFFDTEDAVVGFRKAGSIFEGHVERTVPGIEWGTGNLGQGLSAGCGFALASRLLKRKYHTFVLMGDGEQQKGQISEARRFAAKYGLHDLTVLIDNNNLQISGSIGDIMPQNIKENFTADGWKVLEIDGHDIQQIYNALYTAYHDSTAPVAILAATVMGKGVSFMENDEHYHGVALNEKQYKAAMSELSLESEAGRYSIYKSKRSGNCLTSVHSNPPATGTITTRIATGIPEQYTKDDMIDNRSAFGNALKSLAEGNAQREDSSPIAVLDCDLAGSVKTTGFQKVLQDNFFEAGIQEHNAATISGALSIEGVLAFFADFGVFGICETYNQHRLNDINHTNLKLVCTHVGLDVGEDGKTHQCIDYIGLFQNLYGFRVLIPADPNQTDRATRYMSETHGNFLMCMGRSKVPVIVNESGQPFFSNGYEFRYGAMDTVRNGDDAVIITCGGMLHRAVRAWEILKEKSINVRILNACCPKDLDSSCIADAAETGVIVTYEDHNVHTGLGSAVANKLMTLGASVRLRKLGITGYSLSGSPNDIYNAVGLDVDSLVKAVEDERSRK